MSSHAPHPNCMLSGCSTRCSPTSRRQVAEFYGATPSNTKSCPQLNKDLGKAADIYHCGDVRRTCPASRLWKTPQADCGNGSTDCMDYSAWPEKWYRGSSRAREPARLISGGRRAAPPRRRLRHGDDPDHTKRLRRRSSSFFFDTRKTRRGLTLAAPLSWMLVVYLVSLLLLLANAFWRVDSLTGTVVRDWGWRNFDTVFSGTGTRRSWKDVYLISLHTVSWPRSYDRRPRLRIPDRLLRGPGGVAARHVRRS